MLLDHYVIVLFDQQLSVLLDQQAPVSLNQQTTILLDQQVTILLEQQVTILLDQKDKVLLELKISFDHKLLKIKISALQIWHFGLNYLFSYLIFLYLNSTSSRTYLLLN